MRKRTKKNATYKGLVLRLNNVPSEDEAFRFSFDSLGGRVSCPVGKVEPFGAHGPPTLKMLGVDFAS